MQGFFGKIPSHGDFVTRNLAREFIDVWDEWLQHAVAASKSDLGEAWLETYLTSPIWRFVLMPGVCGGSGWAGILMPSVDRVGRYFPLTVASSLEDAPQPFKIAADAESWFDAAEELALQVLEQEKLNADTLESSISTLDDAVLHRQAAENPLLAGGEWGLRAMGSTGQSLSSAVSHELVQFQVGRYSLWWNNGSDALEPMSLVAPELPNPVCFARLLEGSWGDSFDSETFASVAEEPEAAVMPGE